MISNKQQDKPPDEHKQKLEQSIYSYIMFCNKTAYSIDDLSKTV